MKVTDVKVDAACTFGKKMLLVGVSPSYVYREGKRTEEVEGYRYEIVLPERAFEKVGVKIPGAQRMQEPTEGAVEVAFEGLEVFIYWRQGEYAIGASATNVHENKHA